MISTKKGFTLIELLVVIAIIGILASIVLVTFPSAQDRANDSRIISAMSQIRTQATLYESEFGSYLGLNGAGGCGVAEITPLCDEVDGRNGAAGGDPTFAADADNYCAYTTLLAESGGDTKYYCVDSQGVAYEGIDNPGDVDAGTCGIDLGGGMTYTCQ